MELVSEIIAAIEVLAGDKGPVVIRPGVTPQDRGGVKRHDSGTGRRAGTAGAGDGVFLKNIAYAPVTNNADAGPICTRDMVATDPRCRSS